MSDSAVKAPPARSRRPMQERSQQRAAAAIEVAGPMSEARGPEEASMNKSGLPPWRELLLVDAAADDNRKQPDDASRCVEIAFTGMQYGYCRDGRLSQATRKEAVRATTAYLATFA